MISHILKATFVTLLLAVPLQAQPTYNWSGGSGNWSATNNWTFSSGGTNIPAFTPPNSPSVDAQVTTANSTVAVDSNYAVGELGVGATDKVNINNGKTLTVFSTAGFSGAGTINNAGIINVNSSGATTALILNGNISFTGGGTVNLNGGTLVAASGSSTYTNVDNTIQGGGTLISQTAGSSFSTVTNESSGTIDASQAGQFLALNTANIQNTGTLEASNGGTLLVSGTNGSTQLIDTGGTIKALANSTINFGQYGSANLTNTAVSAQSGTVILGQYTTINGGTLSTTGTGVIETPTSTSNGYPNVTVYLNNVTNSGNYVGNDGSTTNVSGTLVNSGNIAINGTTYGSSLVTNGNVTLSGGGTITLNGGLFATSSGGNSNLTNVDNTIQGGSSLLSLGYGSSYLGTLTNGGTFNATGTGQYLAINAGTLQNTGTLEASNGGTLLLGGTNGSTSLISNGGAITAQSGSTVQLSPYSSASLTNTAISAQSGTVIFGQYTSINGGTLSTTGTGKIETPISTSNGYPNVMVYLTNITNSGNYVGNDGSTTNVSGTLVNSGNIAINGSTYGSTLAVSGNVTLSGGGTITLNGGLFATSSGGNSNLTNVDNTIQGGSSLLSLGYGSSYLGTLTNGGTFNATGTGQYLAINASTIQNTGTLEASNGGTLLLGGTNGSTSLISNGGAITAQSGSTVQLSPYSSASLTNTAVSAQSGTVIFGQYTSINGGTLSTTGTGKIETPISTSNGYPNVMVYLTNITNSGNYVGNDGSTTNVSGTLVNSGNIAINGSTYGSALAVSGNVTLSGGGTITLNGGLFATSSGGNSNLTNVDNTIQGGSSLLSLGYGSSYLGTLTNGGTFNATGTGQYLAINASTLQNTGTLEASNGGTLLLGGTNGSTSLISNGGAITAQSGSTVQLSPYSSASLTNTAVSAQSGTVIFGQYTSINGGTLSTTGTGKIETPILTSNGYPNVMVYLTNITNSGNYVGNDGSTTNVSGTLVNSGNIAINGSTYGSALAVSGNVTLSGGGTITLNGGVITGANSGNNFNSNLDNVDNTIQGGAPGTNSFFANSLNQLTNETNGTINANRAGQNLDIFANSIQNSGTIEATNFGTLRLGGQYGNSSLFSTAGTIEAGSGSNVQLGNQSNLSGTAVLALDGGTVTLGQNAQVTNGFMGTVGTGKIVAAASSNVSFSNVTNAATYVGNDGSTTTLNGAIVNSGSMSFNSTGGNTALAVSGNTTLSGGGTVTLKNGTALEGASFNPGGSTLTNVDNTIQGGSAYTGFPQGNQIGTVTNGANGTINANAAGETLVVNAGNVQNSGTLEATNFSTLRVTGSVLNQSGGVISASAGATVNVNQGVSNNAGVIALTNGTFDNGGNALNNTGQIVGNGTINTGGLSNNGTVTLAGGATTVNGSVTNAAGHTISVLQDTAIFTGDVVNNGTFRSTNAAATFQGTFTNNGAFITDPSTFNFTNLNIGTNGSIVAGAGDVFNISGDLTNNSTSTETNIAQATLSFTGTGSHTVTLNEASTAFTVNTLEVAAGGSLTFDLAAGSSLFVSNLNLLGGAAQLENLTVNGGTLYYDPSLPSNSYLNDQTYTLAGGGQLVAGIETVPEPSTWALLLGGVGTLFFFRRKNGIRS